MCAIIPFGVKMYQACNQLQLCHNFKHHPGRISVPLHAHNITLTGRFNDPENQLLHSIQLIRIKEFQMGASLLHACNNNFKHG